MSLGVVVRFGGQELAKNGVQPDVVESDPLERSEVTSVYPAD